MIQFCLPFHLCPLIRCSFHRCLHFCDSPFRYLCHSRFGQCSPPSMLCRFGRLFLVSSLGSCFSEVGFRSPSLMLFSSSLASLSISVRYQSLGALVPSIQSFVVLHRHRRLVCACLVCGVFLTSYLLVVLIIPYVCLFLLRGDFGLLLIILPLSCFFGSLHWSLITLICV